jgi:hypothetical protein
MYEINFNTGYLGRTLAASKCDGFTDDPQTETFLVALKRSPTTLTILK